MLMIIVLEYLGQGSQRYLNNRLRFVLLPSTAAVSSWRRPRKCGVHLWVWV